MFIRNPVVAAAIVMKFDGFRSNKSSSTPDDGVTVDGDPASSVKV